MSKNLNELLKQLIDLHPKYIDLSLVRLKKLLDKIGNPHLNIPKVIHIAGTNGKGSTLSFVKQILIEHGLKVHSYTSPHLQNFKERITLSNKEISTKKLLVTLKYIKKINRGNPITFFEITTAAAFYLFSKQKADFVILETGLGGRLDATNVIKESLIDIITPIGIDHQEFLGKGITKITNEKLGIIKKGSKVIVSKQKKEVMTHIKKKLKKTKNKLSLYNDHYKILKKDKKEFILKYNNKILNFKNPKLIGYHQIENASTAIITILKLTELGYAFNKNKINKGILKTIWPCRLERKKLKKIPIYLDGAHNIDGATKLLDYFKFNNLKIWLIIGMLNNKNLQKFLEILKPILIGTIGIKIPDEKNSFTTKEINQVCKKLKIKNYEKKSITDANEFLLNKINPELILITGSLYLVGKVRKIYL